MPLRLLDTAIRAEWEAGRDPDQLPADADRGGLTDAAWHNRARTGLPNGLCGLPRQQTCDHSNKCLTCPVFITTSSDLPAHEEHRRRTLTLITQLEDRGQTRLADQNRAVLDHRGDRGAGQDRQQALDTGGQVPGCSTTASASAARRRWSCRRPSGNGGRSVVDTTEFPTSFPTPKPSSGRAFRPPPACCRKVILSQR